MAGEMKPYDLVEHTLVADSLMEIRRYCVDLHAEMVARYGKEITRRRLGYLTAKIDHVRSAMVQQLLEDRGVQADPALWAIYFPRVATAETSTVAPAADQAPRRGRGRPRKPQAPGQAVQT